MPKRGHVRFLEEVSSEHEDFDFDASGAEFTSTSNEDAATDSEIEGFRSRKQGSSHQKALNAKGKNDIRAVEHRNTGRTTDHWVSAKDNHVHSSIHY